MSWRKRFQKDIEDKQRKADEALIIAKVNYLDAINLRQHSERIARSLLREQRENNFGPRLFGLES